MFATLLDFDGVIVDSEPVHLAAFNDVLGPLGLAIEPREYEERYLSLDDAAVFRARLARGGRTPPEEEVSALVAAKSPRFMARFATGFRVFPGAAELVVRRARRGPVAIVSGALEEEIVFALDRMGVRAHVSCVVSADRAPASKPDPAPFLMALSELGRAGHVGRAVALEDSAGGVTAARRAGLRCIAVTHSTTAGSLLAAGADAAVPDLASVTDALLEGEG